MKSCVIAYIVIMAAIIVFALVAAKFFLWWDGIWVVLGILCGLGMWAGTEIESRLKKKKE